MKLRKVSIRGAVQKKLTFLTDMSVKGGGGLENVIFLLGINKKCLECSETQEYAKKIKNFL